MILPTKHIPGDRALIGVGARVLDDLKRPRTVTSLWEATKSRPEVGTFERFALVLALLYTIGAVELHDGLLVRRS